MIAWEGVTVESRHLRRQRLECRFSPPMSQCKHHPQSSSEGVCHSCLQKKLKSVRWSEPGDCEVVVPPSKPGAKLGAPVAKPKPFVDSVHPKEAIAILGSIASIKNRNQRGFHPMRDITEVGLDFVLDSRYNNTDGVPNQPFETSTTGGIPTLCPPSNPSNAKDRKRWSNSTSAKKLVPAGKSLALQDSKPLVDRFAKETALRVIREVTVDEISVEGEEDDEDHGNGKAAVGSFFSPSHLLSKWGLKGIGGSPLATSSNKVFPSKQLAEMRVSQTHSSPGRRDQSRVHILTTSGADDLRPASGDRIKVPGVATKVAKEETVIVGMPDRILKPEDMSQRLRTSYNTVLLWLEDLPVPDTLLNQNIGDSDQQDPSMKETRHIGRFKQDLAVVGHLHEIAEGHEILDQESSVESEAVAAPSAGNHLNEVSSFGKFLIRAAQRQPKQGLSRVQARATALTAR